MSHSHNGHDPSDDSGPTRERLKATHDELLDHLREEVAVKVRVERIEAALVAIKGSFEQRDTVLSTSLQAIHDAFAAHVEKDDRDHAATLKAVRHVADEVSKLHQDVGAVGRFVEGSAGAARTELDTLTEEQIALARRADSHSIRVGAVESRLRTALTSKPAVAAYGGIVVAVLHEALPHLIRLFGG